MFSLNPLSRVRIEYKDSQQNPITWQTLKMGSNFQKKRERERDSNSQRIQSLIKNVPNGGFIQEIMEILSSISPIYLLLNTLKQGYILFQNIFLYE